MSTESILNSNIDIQTMFDEAGRVYYSAKVSFSNEDVLTVSRNSIRELMDDLPSILLSAMQARIVQEQFTC